MPPGLEDLVDPKEAAAKLVASERALRHKLQMVEANEVLWGVTNSPGGDVVFGAPFDFDAQQLLLSTMQQPQLSEVSEEPLFIERQQHKFPPFPEEAPHQRLFATHLAGCGLAPSTSWDTQAQIAHALPEAVFGLLEYPTVGSQEHQFGTCRPCAFLYTKGCNNGVLCPFCHLCDVGERKRRAKANRAAKKLSGH